MKNEFIIVSLLMYNDIEEQENYLYIFINKIANEHKTTLDFEFIVPLYIFS